MSRSNDDLYQSFKERFESCSDQELVNAFNRETRGKGWVSARGKFLHALGAEFRKRDLDASIIVNDRYLNLNWTVAIENGKLVRRDKAEGGGVVHFIA